VGYYRANCTTNQTGLSACTQCPASQLPSGAAYVDRSLYPELYYGVCSWACPENRYYSKQDNACVHQNGLQACESGFQRLTSGANCTRCPDPLPANATYDKKTAGYTCDFTCDQGFFLQGAHGCQPCTTSCGVHEYMSQRCTSNSDAVCTPCLGMPAVIETLQLAAYRTISNPTLLQLLDPVFMCKWDCALGYKRGTLSGGCVRCRNAPVLSEYILPKYSRENGEATPLGLEGEAAAEYCDYRCLDGTVEQDKSKDLNGRQYYDEVSQKTNLPCNPTSSLQCTDNVHTGLLSCPALSPDGSQDGTWPVASSVQQCETSDCTSSAYSLNLLLELMAQEEENMLLLDVAFEGSILYLIHNHIGVGIIGDHSISPPVTLSGQDQATLFFALDMEASQEDVFLVGVDLATQGGVLKHMHAGSGVTTILSSLSGGTTCTSVEILLYPTSLSLSPGKNHLLLTDQGCNRLLMYKVDTGDFVSVAGIPAGAGGAGQVEVQGR